MNFYLPDGWVDLRAVRGIGMPFIFLLGGRGTGKTFGALDTCIQDHVPFALMRRTQRQVDLISNPMLSPIRPICRKRGIDIITAPVVDGISGFYKTEVGEDGKRIQTGDPLGIICALSTIGKVRGFDGETVKVLFYDEFIPEQGDRPLKEEADKFFNAYETLNRNRELSGAPALQAICMGNANDLNSPIFFKLNLLQRLERMQQTGQQFWKDPARGIAIVFLRDSPVSAKKKDTALYRLTAGTEFAEMAIDNQFAYEDRGRIVSRPLAEYKPVVGVGTLTIYRHKSRREFYISEHRRGSPPVFGTGDTELERFRRSYGWLYREYLDDTVDFETYPAQIMLTKYLNM